MERDDIIRMAREADAYAIEKLPYGKYQPDRPDVRDLHFAALVSAHEREECAKECETLLPSQRIYDRRFYDAVGECVATIRARGKA